jgi:hypothetical protein
MWRYSATTHSHKDYDSRGMNMRRFCSIIWLSLALGGLAFPIAAEAQVICVSNVSAPPEIPDYEQPPLPAAGYMWIPGYWASGPTGYFWVPGTWVQPPTIGLLWTPGYWGWRDGVYVWNAGYWGPHIGFYGGVNYGFGYGGIGFEGGRWENGVFAYNRTVNNFGGVTITNVYEKTVIVEPGARVSFNGGSGGTTVRPTAQEEAAAHEQHVAALPAQFQHERTASANKALLASENHGRPAIAATAKPGEFTGKGVVAAREEKPGAALPGAKPAGAAAVAPNANAPNAPKTLENNKTHEKKGPEGKNEATLDGRTPPKPATIEAKPNVEAKPNTEVKRNVEAKPPPTAPPASNAKPAPHVAAAPKPQPAAPAKPDPHKKPQ